MGITNMSMKITAVFMLFMIYAFNCGRLQGSYNLDVVADGILANLTEFKQNAIAQFQRKNLTLDEQDSIYERLGDKVEELHKEMKNFHNKFEMVVEKMSNQTRVNELIHKKNYLEHLFREIKKMGEEKEKEMRSKERETRPHGKRNGTEDEDENKNSTRNSTRRPNGKNSHRTDDEDEDNYHGGELDDEGEDEDENLDVVADRILANLKEFKQYAIAQFQSKNFTNHAFERLGDRFETVQKELKNYRYKFYQAAEKMNNKTRVNELMEKTHLMEKISRELNKMGEEKENEMRSKRRETRPHGKENQGKGPDGPHEKDDEDEDENLDVVADGILANLTEFKQNAIAQFQRKNLALDEQDSIYERLGDKVEELHKEMKNFHNKFEMVV